MSPAERRPGALRWAKQGGAWETERMSKAMAEASTRHLGFRLTIASYRHVAVAFSRDVVHTDLPPYLRFTDFHSEDPLADGDDGEEGEAGTEPAAALQTAHSRATREGQYAVPKDLVGRLSSRSLDVFRQVSRQWHRFLGMDVDAKT